MTAPPTPRRTAVVTIVGSNYLSRAGVLRASVRRHQPDWEFVTVVVDVDRGDELSAADVGTVWTPEDLGIDPVDLTAMGYLYNVTEFCTAIKPAALLRLLDDGADRVLYIDPDTRLFQPADSVTALLAEHDVVLTPHSLAPIPDDGLDPTHDNIRSCGSFNLGFFAGTTRLPRPARLVGPDARPRCRHRDRAQPVHRPAVDGPGPQLRRRRGAARPRRERRLLEPARADPRRAA